MMWAEERPSHASCPFKLKGWTVFERPTKSDGNATGRCYAIYCCPLRLIRVMCRRASPPPPPTPPLPPPPPAMAAFPALSAKRESEVMYKSSRGQFTPDLTWQSWRADCTGAHSHPLPLPHHALVLQTAPMLTVMHELQYKKKQGVKSMRCIPGCTGHKNHYLQSFVYIA